MSFDDDKRHLERQTFCLRAFSRRYGLTFDEDLPKLSHFDAFLFADGERLALCEFKGRKNKHDSYVWGGETEGVVFCRVDKYDWMAEAEGEHGLKGLFVYGYDDGLFWITKADVPTGDVRTLNGRDGAVPAYFFPARLLIAAYLAPWRYGPARR